MCIMTSRVWNQIAILFVGLTASLYLACSDDSEQTPNDASPGDTGTDAEDGSAADVEPDSDSDTDAGAVDAADAQDTIDDADAADGSAEPLPSPLQADAPWPKFRHDIEQTGRTDRLLTDDGAAPWVFETGKGIFSSPVVAADGTIYVGSADRNFYAISPDGSERWRATTGEIIDSAALLDDQGRVYVGSGDGFLYAFDAATGEEIWRFGAESAEETGAFINWFEGNVAITWNGTLVVPNDNFRIYGVARDTGEQTWSLTMPDQTWSSPALRNPDDALFIGNNNVLGVNTFSFTSAGRLRWETGTIGTVSASPLLTTSEMVLGSFDGYLRAYDPDTGRQLWSVPTRDHIYASAALLSDGAIILPSADGTVYAVEPGSGAIRWAYDHGAPIRSSPAVDGEDHIYLGTGDGKLLVLNGDGTLRWTWQAIQQDRDDMNASPALGEHAIYLAGESGEVFGVPYDFCLRAEESGNSRCRLGPDEPLADDEARLLYTTAFGSALNVPAQNIASNEAIRFTLSVREEGDTQLALIDNESLTVTLVPDLPASVVVSGDRRFVVITPEEDWTDGINDELSVQLQGTILRDPEREGLALTGGTPAGNFDETFVFDINAPTSPPALEVGLDGDATVFEMRRLAAPLPTLLPSYNQIGFDSLHFLVTLVDTTGEATDGEPERGVAWVVEGRPGADGITRLDPLTRGVFAFQYRYQDGNLTLLNERGLELEVMSFIIGFNRFRVAASFDAEGMPTRPADVIATTVCGDINFYGPFLRRLGMCNPDDDTLTAAGAVILEPWSEGTAGTVDGTGIVNVIFEADAVRVTFNGSTLNSDDHHVAILLVDAQTGAPLPLSYGTAGSRTVNEDGTLSGFTLLTSGVTLPPEIRAYVMVDLTVVATGTNPG